MQFNLIRRNSSVSLGRPWIMQVLKPVGIVIMLSCVLFSRNVSRSRPQTPLLMKRQLFRVNLGKLVSLLSGLPMTPTTAAIPHAPSTSRPSVISTTWPDKPFIDHFCNKLDENTSFCNVLLMPSPHIHQPLHCCSYDK